MTMTAKNTVIRKVTAILAVCSMMCTAAMPMTAAAARSTVDTYSVCIRSEPNGTIIGYATEGTTFEVTKTSSGWYYSDSIPGTSGKTLCGWVSASLCTGGSTSAAGNSGTGSASGKKVSVTAAIAVTLRTGAGTSYEAIGWIGNGLVLSVIKEKDGWYQVTYNGKTGWISGKYAKPVSTSGSVSGSQSGTVNKTGISLNFWDSFNYAKKYWNTKNPDYFFYDGMNCCNFVSQILVAGGFPTCNMYKNQSIPFVRISEFVPYMRNTYGVSYIENPRAEDIEAGDVILTNDGGHVMFCMKNNTATNKIYCSGNTNNQDSAVIPIYAIDAVLKTSVFYH